MSGKRDLGLDCLRNKPACSPPWPATALLSAQACRKRGLSIDVWVDGTPLSSAAPGGPSMPGRIDFVTNPGPTGSLVRLSIDSVGNTWLRTAGQPGVTPPGTTGSVNGTVSCYNHQVYGGI